jgi:UDP-N-acetylmuramoylalanine--D-glutamate ligase
MKKPTLFGYGITTRAIAARFGGGCTFFDDQAAQPYSDAEGNKILPSHLFDPEACDLAVTTPSLKPTHPLIQKAKAVLSEYDYILGATQIEGQMRSLCDDLLIPDVRPKPYTIWISGTNGKTTTTQMLAHLLAQRGALAGGNIGTPLAALDPAAPIWILESSSFALHHTRTASPDLYLLLPITPDHLDWHQTPEAYEADKCQPLRTMREGELALIPAGLSMPPTDAFVVAYDSLEFLADYFSIDTAQINFKAAFLEDAVLALAVTRVLFDEVNYDAINAFRLDANRQQEMHDAMGRLWVNDTKATNLDAAIQALRAYGDRTIHLIAGGEDKGVDLAPLFEAMRSYCVTLYTIGANESKQLALAATYDIPAVSCKTLESAVQAIDSAMRSEDVGLLSPAAASFDQFDDYAHRGRVFMEAVKKLRVH